MRRLISLLLVIGALLLLGISSALGADTEGTAMDLGMTSGKPDDHGEVTSQRLVDDARLIETDVRLPVLPAERTLIQR